MSSVDYRVALKKYTIKLKKNVNSAGVNHLTIIQVSRILHLKCEWYGLEQCIPPTHIVYNIV